MSQQLGANKAIAYFSEDTIAAVATPLGGALAVIRISGPQALSIIDGISSRPISLFKPREMTRVLLRAHAAGADEQHLDDVLAARYPAPQSYTGEDVVEIFAHGGAFTVSRVMEALVSAGARQALPGEFSFRAVKNGKMNLSQAQGVADFIAASNERAAGLAMDKMNGAESRLIKELADQLRDLAAEAEASIDFSDQDIEDAEFDALKRSATEAIGRLKVLESTYARGRRLQDGIRVAFVGLPNVGKSSYFNALLGEDRSIVSEVAGTTRDVVRESLTLQGKLGSVTLRLEDTAGLQLTEDRIEKMGIERTYEAARTADLLLLLVDASNPRKEIEALEAEWLRLGKPVEKTLGIFTKCDRLDPEQFSEASLRELLGISNWLQTSAVSGQGINESASRIADFCEKWIHRDPGEVLLTRLDQVQAVGRAIEHANRACNAVSIDLFAADLRQSLYSLGALIGETVPDDLLNRIFSKFCIGK